MSVKTKEELLNENKDLRAMVTRCETLIAEKDKKIADLRRNSAKVREALWELLTLADTREK
jgi:hypothetical protein